MRIDTKDSCVSDAFSALVLVAVVVGAFGIIMSMIIISPPLTTVPYMTFIAGYDGSNVYIQHTGGDILFPDSSSIKVIRKDGSSIPIIFSQSFAPGVQLNQSIDGTPEKVIIVYNNQALIAWQDL